MTLDNMTAITEGSYTGFCKSQLITCNRVKECNGVCPFEDALKHADKTQTMNDQHTVDHDREWIIGCIKHDGFIKTDRFDKANQIILDALSAEAKTKCVAQIKVDTEEVARRIKEEYDITDGWIPCSERLPEDLEAVNVTWVNHNPPVYYQYTKDVPNADTAVYYRGVWYWWDSTICDVLGEYGEKCGAEQIDKDIEILAWMPIPKPYKGGDDE